MQRKLALFTIFIICCLVGPALYACEDCITAGTKDPSGGTSDKVRCYASSQGLFEICTVLPDFSDCDLQDTDPTACPISTGDGGSGGGTGSGDCVRDTMGVCPPECMSCSGGGGGGFLI